MITRTLRRHRLAAGILFGAAGGIVGWLVGEPVRHLALEGADHLGLASGSSFAVRELAYAAVFAAYIGIFVGVIDGALAGNLRALGVGGWIGGLAGLLAGLAGTILGTLAFAGLKDLPWGSPVARAIGWGLLGAAMGLGPGLAMRASDRAARGALGGLAGGLAGGALFSGIAWLSTQDLYARLAGIPLLGATLGACYALAEAILRRSWLTVLSGPSEGVDLVLPPRAVTVGAGDTCDLQVRADPPLPGKAIVVHPRGDAWVLTPLEAAEVTVNKGPEVGRGPRVLADGDVIRVGGVRILFSSRTARRDASTIVTIGGDARPVPAPGRTVCRRAHLEWLDGSHKGRRVALERDRLTIGRDEACDLVIDELSVSMRHAEIVRKGINWVVFDLGSTNGTHVQGRPVSENALRPGFVVTFGQVGFRYVEES